MEQYLNQGYRMGRLEAQKLAYFLQEAGEPLKLNYVKHHYGPYAHNLNHVLRHLDGYYIRGFGDGSRHSQMSLMSGAADEAKTLLSDSPEASERLKRVQKLIEGFETPYGLELLATIHWIVKEHPEYATDCDKIVEQFQEWNERKREKFKFDHICVACERLRDEGWLPTPELT